MTSRAEAKKQGLKRYFSGVACPNGHLGDRMVSNYKCVRCLREGSEHLRRARHKRLKLSKKWHDANREKHNAQSLQHYHDNVEHHKSVHQAYRKANPLVIRACTARRRALKRGAEGTHTAEDVNALYSAQDATCNACPADLALGFHVDHIIPLSRGGSNGPNNLQLLCPGCNCSKGAKTMEEWERLAG